MNEYKCDYGSFCYRSAENFSILRSKCKMRFIYVIGYKAKTYYCVIIT